jgi:oligosaccharide repeat unit polymerase
MVYLISSILVIFIVHKKFSLFDLLNPFVIFVLYYIFFFFIALSWKENFFIHKGVKIDDYTVNVISASLLVILISSIIFSFVFKFEKSISANYLRKIDLRKLNFGASTKRSERAAWVIFFLGVVLFLIFILKVGQVPLLADDAENLRIEARKGNGFITILSIALLTYSASYIFASMNIATSKRIIILIVAFFILMMFGNRGPAFLLLIFAFVINIVRSKTKVNIFKVVLLGLIGYLLLVGIGAYRMNADADFLTKFILTIGWRPFVNIQNFDIILNHFDDFLYTQINVSKLFGPRNITTDVMKIL